MSRYLGKAKFASKKLDAVLSEWEKYSELIKLNSYHFALRFLSPLSVKDNELSVAIGAAAYAILTENWFCNNWHDKLTEICEEGYEAGFMVRDIISHYSEHYNKTFTFTGTKLHAEEASKFIMQKHEFCLTNFKEETSGGAMEV